ncbi:major facilitator transporter [Vibrio vulnificus CladeA-yb158]|uniref:MFS transporter n=1 Tax=Vibrio vulnificus TaxID=672 RepID=UPI00063DBF31|nr:MFS transporter [Vibrio vulnificus]KLI67825.1 major facilitator transporter [Vibrio vulnificus CladeA-yb158]MCG6292742.1 MFS transporter [Vibrio vulnificus]
MDKVKQHSRLMLGALLVVLSLMLIFVVGYAQALKSYQQQTRDAVMAQTEAARIGIEQVLSSGVPLHDIAGLEKVLSPIVNSDPSVVDIRLLSGEQELYRYTSAQLEGGRISIPLNNKFTQVGRLDVLLSDAQVAQTISNSFRPMLWLIAVFLLVFVFGVLHSQEPKIYFTTFGVVFLAMAVSVMLLVGTLYKQGLESKATSMANIVSQRLAPVLRLGIDASQVSGMGDMLESFKRSNEDIASITVMKDGALIAQTRTEQSMMSMANLAQYPVVDKQGNAVTMTFHPKILLRQLLQILKSFAILFAGCAFICFAFIRLFSASQEQSYAEQVLDRIKPLLLVTVLMESLMAPVLPQYLTEVALANGGTQAWSSYFFTLYFVGFAGSLLPASRLVEVFDIRRVLAAGILLSSGGCLLLAYDSHLLSVLLARLLSGVGQAAIFIAVQGYILRFSSQANKTQAAGIIVFCFNAGFISGAAIGALLVESVGVQGIFALSAGIGASMFFFSLLLPSMKMAHQANGSLKDNVQAMLRDSLQLLKVPSFVRTMLLVGIPTKMMLTGVVSFAVPILLSKNGIDKESIGQVLMAYALAVLVVSRKVAPWIDQSGASKWALTAGNGIAAAALCVLGFAFSLQDPVWVVAIATLSMLIMGISHGFINAPVVSHVVNSRAGTQANTVASTYRFLERLGHVMGAIVAGGLLTHLGDQQAFYLLAGFFALAALCLLLFDRHPVREVTR